jgi:hypothetical protein
MQCPAVARRLEPILAPLHPFENVCDVVLNVATMRHTVLNVVVTKELVPQIAFWPKSEPSGGTGTSGAISRTWTAFLSAAAAWLALLRRRRAVDVWME